MRTRAQSADPAAIDVAYLATTYALSQDNLTTLIDAPTSDLIQDLLNSLTIKGQEFDQLRADKLKVDVELENTVRASETKVKAQKAAVTRQGKEVEELRTKLNESEAARELLASEVETLRSSTSGSSAETQALRQRIDTLEASNRDALRLVESKSTENDRVAAELSSQHSKLLAIRREISHLEERNQALENVASTQKFKEQSLQQELDLLKKNNEWHSGELQKRNEDYANLRKERNVRVSSFQRELEESKATVEALKRTEATLRQRLEEAQAKADEAFARFASLQEETARKEQDFRTELSSSKRLSELQQQNAATHRARLLELQNEFEQVQDNSREELGHLQAEVETERLDKEDAERKVAELELKVENLESRLTRPGTPRQNGIMDPTTPGRAGSPSAMPGSLRKVIGGVSFTQLYAQCTSAQEELVGEKRRSDSLATALDRMINELEKKKPEIEDLRSELDRAEQEIMNSSNLLDKVHEERQSAKDAARLWEGKYQELATEHKLREQQLRDLSAQVKILLVEIQSNEQGLGEMSADERLELERVARGEFDDATLDNMTESGRIISERFVIFRNVHQLHDLYKAELFAMRKLSEQMEAADKRISDEAAVEYRREVDILKEQLARQKSEIEATTTQISSYVKERDMFRRMLQHRGQLAPDADLQSMFGQSIGPATPQRNSAGAPATPRNKDAEDLNKLLREQQAFFDQYRNESAEDRRVLKDQVDSFAREKSTLQADLARLHSQLTLSGERYEMLQSNLNALRIENSELQKRSQHMAELAAKQDLNTQQVAERVISLESEKESLVRENANAKAEKDLFKRIEARLTDDNKSLVEERSRLNKLATDLQNLQNERELTDSESRRRLQSRVEDLETELTDTKKRLESEVEDSRKASLRREYEEGQSRTRIDDLVKSLGIVREELVAAKTMRDQLQARVDEMRIELRSAEEKVVALQPRPTPRHESPQDGQLQTNGGSEELSNEQRLAVEISDLRRDLELCKTELENAKQHSEQFRAIAQATEEELANFNETAEQYKEDTDQAFVEKNAKIQELERRVDDLISELTATNNEISELRTKADDSDRLLAEQKATLEADVARLRDDDDRHREEKILFQEDIKAQAEIAQQAQQSYEDELLKHAEAARSLQSVRKEYNELRTEVAGLKAEAEAARVSLEHGEESWTEQAERFERELQEAKRKRQDVDEQNKILHQNLESFSNELAALRRGRAVDTEAQEGAMSANSDGNFQEVIKFLRREKEIVDVQYELSIQEAKRLQQQLEYSSSQLDDVRAKLTEERRRSVEKANSDSSTSKLAQTINELNLFRESATTLRNEARQARERLDEKSQDVDRLLTEIEPLKGRVGELEGELESKAVGMKLLQDDRDHWRERTQNIISKYDRVDPAELEELKKQLEDLREEKEKLAAEQAPLKEQIDTFDSRLETERAAATQSYAERLDRFKSQAKEQDRKRTVQIREITFEKDGIAAELEKIKTDLTAAGEELIQTKMALEKAQVDASRARTDDMEEGQVQENSTDTGKEDQAVLHSKIAEAEANANEHAARVEALNTEVHTLQARVLELEGQAAQISQQSDNAQSNNATPGESVETLDHLKQQLALAQQEVETLRTSASATTQPRVNTEPASGETSVEDQVAGEVAKLRTEMEQQHELAMKQMQDDTDRRIENMKAGLKRQLNEGRARMRTEIQEELLAEHSIEIQQLKDQHNAAIEQLKQEHAVELEKLTRSGGAAIEKAKTSGGAETSSQPISEVDLGELSDAQALDIIRNNPTMRGVVRNQLRAQLEKQTGTLKASIAAKDEEIGKLKEALEKATPGDSVSREELERQLQAAKVDREAAVRQAQENAEKKGNVQKSMLAIAQAKISAVRKAATETPEKAIKEVWEAADKVRPPPAKPAPATDGVAPSSPAPAKPVDTSTPAPAQDSPNPRAAVFTPGANAADASALTASAQNNLAATSSTSAAASRNSSIPQPGTKLPRPPSSSGLQIQGAAAAQGQQQQRGGHGVSGLPRGGSIRGGRGTGRGGNAPANAGTKRQHDGGGEGGDAKRSRGGGQTRGS